MSTPIAWMVRSKDSVTFHTDKKEVLLRCIVEACIVTELFDHPPEHDNSAKHSTKELSEIVHTFNSKAGGL